MLPEPWLIATISLLLLFKLLVLNNENQDLEPEVIKRTPNRAMIKIMLMDTKQDISFLFIIIPLLISHYWSKAHSNEKASTRISTVCMTILPFYPNFNGE